MTTHKVLEFSRSRHIACKDFQSEQGPTLLYNLPNLGRIKCYLDSAAGRAPFDPFSIGSENVRKLLDALMANPEMGESMRSAGEDRAQEISNLHDFMRMHLRADEKKGYVACFPLTDPSIIAVDTRDLPTASYLLSIEFEHYVRGVHRITSFVYGQDELKVVYVALLREMGYDAYLADFTLDPKAYGPNGVGRFKTVPVYLPLSPHSVLDANHRLGIAIIVPTANGGSDEATQMMTFGISASHPGICGFTALDDCEAGGIIYGLKAQRKMVRLILRFNDTKDWISNGELNDRVNNMLWDIREALKLHPDNSVALPVLAQLVDLTVRAIERGVALFVLLNTICDKLAIWQEVYERFGIHPSSYKELRAAINEQDLRQKLILGNVGDMPSLEAAFLLGMCLNEGRAKSERHEMNLVY